MPCGRCATRGLCVVQDARGRGSDLTFAHAQALVDDLVTVDDEAIAGAVRWLFREARVVAEPSDAASVAAVLQAGQSIGPGTVAVISGGNVSPADFAAYIGGVDEAIDMV